MLANHCLIFTLNITGGWVTGGDEPAAALPSDCCCHASVLPAAWDYAGLQAVTGGARFIYLHQSVHVETLFIMVAVLVL
jgi:hypothetical protein